MKRIDEELLNTKVENGSLRIVFKTNKPVGRLAFELKDEELVRRTISDIARESYTHEVMEIIVVIGTEKDDTFFPRPIRETVTTSRHMESAIRTTIIYAKQMADLRRETDLKERFATLAKHIY